MGRLNLKTAKQGTEPLALHIGKKLLALRKCHAVTLRTVAKGTGISNAFVCQVENGQCMPTAMTIWKLAKYFAVTPGFFFLGFKG